MNNYKMQEKCLKTPRNVTVCNFCISYKIGGGWLVAISDKDTKYRVKEDFLFKTFVEIIQKVFFILFDFYSKLCIIPLAIG